MRDEEKVFRIIDSRMLVELSVLRLLKEKKWGGYLEEFLWAAWTQEENSALY